MTDRAIMQQALDALEANLGNWAAKTKAIAALRERLAQPEQEPVGDAWTPCMKLPVVVHVRKQRPGEAHVSTREGITPVNPDDLIMRGVSGEEYPIGRAIFEQTYTLDTAPPQPTEQEPVAWADEIIDDLHAQYNTDGIKEIDSGDALIRLDEAIAAVEEAEKRHTAPPQRKPLTDWQPIKTAPKDGSSYLIADCVRGFVAPVIRGVIYKNKGTSWDWEYAEQATHWMPLPDAPAAHSKENT